MVLPTQFEHPTGGVRYRCNACGREWHDPAAVFGSRRKGEPCECQIPDEAFVRSWIADTTGHECRGFPIRLGEEISAIDCQACGTTEDKAPCSDCADVYCSDHRTVRKWSYPTLIPVDDLSDHTHVWGQPSLVLCIEETEQSIWEQQCVAFVNEEVLEEEEEDDSEEVEELLEDGTWRKVDVADEARTIVHRYEVVQCEDTRIISGSI